MVKKSSGGSVQIRSWLTIILTAVALTVGMVTWAASEHSDIKDYIVDQDRADRQELLDEIREIRKKVEDIHDIVRKPPE